MSQSFLYNFSYKHAKYTVEKQYAVVWWGYEYKFQCQFAVTVEETRSYFQLKQSQNSLL